jgi:hypothetical protein
MMTQTTTWSETLIFYIKAAAAFPIFQASNTADNQLSKLRPDFVSFFNPLLKKSFSSIGSSLITWQKYVPQEEKIGSLLFLYKRDGLPGLSYLLQRVET